MPDSPLNFSERRKQLLEQKAKEDGTWVEPFKEQDIPDVRSDHDSDPEMDSIIASIGVVIAYRKWCNKSQFNEGNRTESIKVSCPLPEHPDTDPSAWLNTEKNVWMCGRCEEGGDVYDLAAIHFGYPRPGYKEGQEFHKLRTQMAEDFGYVIKKVPGGTVIYKEDNDPGVAEGSASEPQSDATQGEAQGSTDAEDGAKVAILYAEEEEELVSYPSIDWRRIVPEDTFLHAYLSTCSADDSPEEYHFWHGLLALGHTAGRNVFLEDHNPVFGNLLLCLLGASGVGKSRSRGWINAVLREVLPYRESGQENTGVKLVAVPGSGEFLVKEFVFESHDPVNPKIIIGNQPVNGVVDFDELAALLTRANRQGSTLKTTVMAMADAREEVHIGSLTHGGFKAVRPFCSITATTQPKAIRNILHKTDAGSGFLNRWVFAGGPPKQREVLGGIRSGYYIDLDPAIRQLNLVRGWAGVERPIGFEDDAYKRFSEFFYDLVYPTQAKDESDLLKRLDLLCKKLALLFTINLKQSAVNLRTVDSIIYMSEYIVNCYGLLEENLGITQNQEIVNEILRHIRRHTQRTKRGASARDLIMYMKGKNYPPDQIKKALETMVALDMIELEKKKPGPGRPAIRYVAVGE